MQFWVTGSWPAVSVVSVEPLPANQVWPLEQAAWQPARALPRCFHQLQHGTMSRLCVTAGLSRKSHWDPHRRCRDCARSRGRCCRRLLGCRGWRQSWRWRRSCCCCLRMSCQKRLRRRCSRRRRRHRIGRSTNLRPTDDHSSGVCWGCLRTRNCKS